VKTEKILEKERAKSLSRQKRNDSWPATKFRIGNAPDDGTVLPVVNLMANSKSEITISYLPLIVTIAPSRFVSEIFECDTQMDGQTTHIATVTGPLFLGNICSMR